MLAHPQRFVRFRSERRTFFGRVSGIHGDEGRSFALALVFEHPEKRPHAAPARFRGFPGSSPRPSRPNPRPPPNPTRGRSSSITHGGSHVASASGRRSAEHLSCVVHPSCSNRVPSEGVHVGHVPTVRARRRRLVTRQRVRPYHVRTSGYQRQPRRGGLGSRSTVTCLLCYSVASLPGVLREGGGLAPEYRLNTLRSFRTVQCRREGRTYRPDGPAGCRQAVFVGAA